MQHQVLGFWGLSRKMMCCNKRGEGHGAAKSKRGRGKSNRAGMQWEILNTDKFTPKGFKYLTHFPSVCSWFYDAWASSAVQNYLDHDVKSRTKNPTFMDVSVQPEGGLPSFSALKSRGLSQGSVFGPVSFLYWFIPTELLYFLNRITTSTVLSALMNDELICYVSLSFRLWDGPPLPHAIPSDLHLRHPRRGTVSVCLHRLHVGEADSRLQQNRAALLWKPPQPLRDPAAARSVFSALHDRRRGSSGGGKGSGEPGGNPRLAPLVWDLVVRARPGVPVGRREKGGFHARGGWGSRLTRRWLAPAGAGAEWMLPHDSDQREQGARVWGGFWREAGIRGEDDRGEHVEPGAVSRGNFTAGS